MGFSHWDYFRDIEAAFRDETQTIGYTSQYYAVHTPQLTDLILTCGAGFLTTAVLICKAVDPSGTYKTLEHCRLPISSRFPGFFTLKVVLPAYNMSLVPWEDWTADHAPRWWSQGYVPLTRDREADKKAGNYWNALYAAAGLFCGILHYHKLLFHGAAVDPEQAPCVFQPKRLPGPRSQAPGRACSLPDD